VAESAVHLPVENSCNLWTVMVLCGSRLADIDFRPARKNGTAREKVRKRKGQRSTYA